MTLCSRYIRIAYNVLRTSQHDHSVLPILMCRSVFRSMISLANSSSQRDPVNLTDPLMENSDVVLQVLDIIYTLGISADTIEDDVDLVKYAIDFARKWEMTMVIDIIHKELSRIIDSKTGTSSHFEHFLVALHLGDNDLAADMYAGCGDEEWEGSADDGIELPLIRDCWSSSDGSTPGLSDNDDKAHEEDKHYLSDKRSADLFRKDGHVTSLGGDIFNMGRIPYGAFLQIPPTVVWIILRAQEIATLMPEEGQAKEHVQALLNRACESMCRPSSCATLLKEDPPAAPSKTTQKRKAAD